MKISVIIPTWNRDKILKSVLIALTEQTIGVNNFEVIDFKINELNVYLNGLRATLKNIKGNVYYELEDKDFKNYVRKNKNISEELFEEVVGGAIAHDPLNTPNLIDRSFANKDIYFNEIVFISVLESA